MVWFSWFGFCFVLVWFGFWFGLVGLVFVWFGLIWFGLGWFGLVFGLVCFVLFCFVFIPFVPFILFSFCVRGVRCRLNDKPPDQRAPEDKRYRNSAPVIVNAIVCILSLWALDDIICPTCHNLKSTQVLQPSRLLAVRRHSMAVRRHLMAVRRHFLAVRRQHGLSAVTNWLCAVTI